MVNSLSPHSKAAPKRSHDFVLQPLQVASYQEYRYRQTIQKSEVPDTIKLYAGDL